MLPAIGGHHIAHLHVAQGAHRVEGHFHREEGVVALLGDRKLECAGAVRAVDAVDSPLKHLSLGVVLVRPVRMTHLWLACRSKRDRHHHVVELHLLTFQRVLNVHVHDSRSRLFRPAVDRQRQQTVILAGEAPTQDAERRPRGEGLARITKSQLTRRRKPLLVDVRVRLELEPRVGALHHADHDPCSLGVVHQQRQCALHVHRLQTTVAQTLRTKLLLKPQDHTLGDDWCAGSRRSSSSRGTASGSCSTFAICSH
mmetsp:Transcript_5924/g.18862  ORF Transcript_5924/g.18862 Transcript_5924/m.18862 type:complete len:255 (-) Transcript_5924:142-906(-)